MKYEELRIFIDRYRTLANQPPIDEFTGGNLLIRRDVMKAIIEHIDNIERLAEAAR